MTKLGKLAAPVVGTGTRLHADEAGWQVGNELQKFGAGHLRAHQSWFACFIDAVHRKDVLGDINSNGYDSHDFPSQVS